LWWWCDGALLSPASPSEPFEVDLLFRATQRRRRSYFFTPIRRAYYGELMGRLVA